MAFIFSDDDGAADADALADAELDDVLMSALGDDLFLEVASHLPLHDLGASLSVCKSWQRLLDGTALLWRSMCHMRWEDKKYVPDKLCAMADGDHATGNDAEDADAAERQSLMALKVRELKDLMRSLRVQSRAAELIEKSDFADAIVSARRQAAEEGSDTHKLLRCPWMLVRSERGESLPKAALRLSLADATRTSITDEELFNLTFNVRVRSDGPLANAMQVS